MITVKKLVYSLVLTMACSFCISSCDKNAEDMSYLDSRESRSLTSEVITRAPSDYDAKLYEVDDAYKNAYQHYLQEKSACGRTSYVLAVAAIVRGKGNLISTVKISMLKSIQLHLGIGLLKVLIDRQR